MGFVCGETPGPVVSKYLSLQMDTCLFVEDCRRTVASCLLLTCELAVLHAPYSRYNVSRRPNKGERCIVPLVP